MEEERFYTCKYDRTFKEVFLNPDNKDLLKALLESILKIKIEDIKLNKTELLSGNTKVKDKRVDAIVKTANKIINIEINSNYYEFFPARNAAYIFNIYQANYLVGEKYMQDEDIIQINLTWELGVNKININRYMLASIDVPNKYFINNLKILEVNMDYYMKMWYDNISEEIEQNKYIIMLGLNDRELDEMKTEDNIVNKFKTSVKQVNKDPEFIEYMSEEKDRMMKQNTLIYQAEERGEARGKSEGISIGEKHGIIQTAKNMLKKEMSIEDISEITGLTSEEITKLKE